MRLANTDYMLSVNAGKANPKESSNRLFFVETLSGAPVLTHGFVSILFTQAFLMITKLLSVSLSRPTCQIVRAGTFIWLRFFNQKTHMNIIIIANLEGELAKQIGGVSKVPSLIL
jgi:hypothetical protein